MPYTPLVGTLAYVVRDGAVLMVHRGGRPDDAHAGKFNGLDGEPPARNEEGTLHWVPLAEVLDRPLWEGDYTWLPLVFDASVGQFHGVMPYADGRPTGWSVTILPA